MRVDFAKVRAQVSILDYLAHRQIGVRKRNNTEYVADCPLKSHAQSAHQKGTFAISTAKEKWYCHAHTCREAGGHPKGGDVIDLAARLENLSPLDAARLLQELFLNGERPREISTAKPEPEATGNKPLAFELKGITPEHPFIQAKGISVETARAFGVGFFPGKGSMANRIVFPLYNNLCADENCACGGEGKLIGYAGRTVLEISDTNPKWKLPSGLVKDFIYGLHWCDHDLPVILTESLWGPLWFFEKGKLAASLMGSTMTPEQEKCLEPFKEIVVAMDNDEAGREAAQKICDRLRRNHKVSKAFLKD